MFSLWLGFYERGNSRIGRKREGGILGLLCRHNISGSRFLDPSCIVIKGVCGGWKEGGGCRGVFVWRIGGLEEGAEGGDFKRIAWHLVVRYVVRFVDGVPELLIN